MNPTFRPLVLASLATLAFALVPSYADAQGKPTAVNLAPGAKVTLGRPLVVKMTGPRGADSLRCQVLQGDLQPNFDVVDDMKKGECVIPSLGGVGSNYKPGPARLVMDAWVGHSRLAEAEIPIELVAAKPAGGAGTQFDSGYWANYGGGQGSMAVKDVVVKNGVLSMTIMIDKCIAFPRVTGIVVDKDGTIVSQTIPLGAWTPVAGEKIYPDYKREADATKSITVTGHFDNTVHGRSLEMRVEGALLPGENEHNYYERRFYRNDEKGEVLGYSGGGSSGGSSGGGGGGDACKKACFHREATCSGNRGACMKARQQCVSACR